MPSCNAAVAEQALESPSRPHHHCHLNEPGETHGGMANSLLRGARGEREREGEGMNGSRRECK